MSVHRRARRLSALIATLLAGTLGCASQAGVGHAADPAGPGCAEPVAAIYDRVAPAVVFIAATTVNPYRLSDRVSRVVASGVLLEPTGLILTNAHVAYGRQVLRVTLDDGTALPAELVGADPIFDLALIRVAPPSGAALPVAKLGDSSQVRVGDEVLALGNPLGLEQTLTRGIVSSINRVLPDVPRSLAESLIQTDAAINPGNSGGPLLDRCGLVIGINTATIPDAQSIGFAVPINLARTIIPDLVQHGHVVRPWVGFHGQLLGEELRRLLRMPLAPGLAVEVVETGSPAERAGLRGGHIDVEVDGQQLLLGGDIVTEINGVHLTDADRLEEAMRALKVGGTLRLVIFRDGAIRRVEYALPERPVLPSDVAGSRAMMPIGRRGRPAGP
jgi:serine protease Do